MNKIDKIKQKYVTDAKLMASKARFGYFSILPSHATAVNQFQSIKRNNQSQSADRDSDGKVHTEPRNIYSGITSTGSLKKNVFSYIPSAITSSLFQDPGKHERLQQLSQSKKWQEKDTYKPAKLTNTIISAAYQYISPTDPKQPAKSHRDTSGKVITQNSNVLTSPTSKLEFEKLKEFKYVECPSQKKDIKYVQQKNTNKKGQNGPEEPFKTGAPKSKLFYSYSQMYFDGDLKRKEGRKEETIKMKMNHQEPFKPSCISPGKDFSRLAYTEEGKGRSEIKRQKKENRSNQVHFKLTKIENNSRPTPSIAYLKINVLRGIR